jgi:hypothetical protein
MGDHLLNWLRLCRVKQPVFGTLTYVETYEESFPMLLKRLLQDDEHWEVMVIFCMMGAPMMKLLRLADSCLPSMDKAVYFVDKAEHTILKHAKDLNTLFFSPQQSWFQRIDLAKND